MFIPLRDRQRMLDALREVGTRIDVRNSKEPSGA